ncbi:hypothetical protein R1flu_022543 [Riccia fluitans]|uniref:LYR motif-containing protein 2 n=1 Tax=Riccia fluitans TaxID=41844 RepID=A0ABD1XPJ9_9MARC
MLNLRQFLLRIQVLHLYRTAVRSVRRAPPSARGELLRTIREEVERNRDVKDPQQIRFLLGEGSQRLKELNSMLGIQGHD